MSFVALPVFFEITMLLFPFCLWHDDDSRKHLWRHLPIKLVANTNTFRPELIVTQDTLITFAPTKNRTRRMPNMGSLCRIKIITGQTPCLGPGPGSTTSNQNPLESCVTDIPRDLSKQQQVKRRQNAKDWNTVLAIELDQLTELQVVV